MTKKQTFRLVFSLFTLVCLAFIWGNSMVPGVESGEISEPITEWINSVVQKVFPSVEISHLFVRKAAHFIEFSILGALAAANWVLWFPEKRRVKILAMIPCCFLVALADEIIQSFFEGRASSFLDVLLDTSGSTVAVLIFLCVMLKRDASKKRSEVDLNT